MGAEEEEEELIQNFERARRFLTTTRWDQLAAGQAEKAVWNLETREAMLERLRERGGTNPLSRSASLSVPYFEIFLCVDAQRSVSLSRAFTTLPRAEEGRTNEALNLFDLTSLFRACTILSKLLATAC